MTVNKNSKIILSYLWHDVGQVEGVVHRRLAEFVIPGRCHVTPAPARIPEVLVARASLLRQVRIGPESSVLPICLNLKRHNVKINVTRQWLWRSW